MATLPTISAILTGVAAGTYTPQQAMVWIDLHIGINVDAATDLDGFAALAMQTVLADREFLRDIKNRNLDPCMEVARKAYEHARAMKTARSE